MKKVINYFNKIQWTILILITILTLYFENLSSPMGILSAAAGITGLMCVLEVGEGRLSNYYWGIVNVVLYSILSYNAKLYGDFMLNAFYYFPMQFIGIYMWKKHRTDDGVLETKLMTGFQRIILALVSVIVIVAYSKFLEIVGGNLALIDATSTILSIFAMWLMVKRYAEQWSLWIVVNVVSVTMWTISLIRGEQGAAGMILMWTGYLANAIYGYINWKKMAKKLEAEELEKKKMADSCPYKVEV